MSSRGGEDEAGWGGARLARVHFLVGRLSQDFTVVASGCSSRVAAAPREDGAERGDAFQPLVLLGGSISLSRDVRGMWVRDSWGRS
jgi:hypothetical protein